MDIDYNTILKFLCDDSEDIIFFNKLNIIENSSKFKKFKKFFPITYFRYGIYKYDSNENNISLWTSILYSVDKKYILKDFEEILDLINSIKIDIINNYKPTFEIKNENIKDIINNSNHDLFLEILVNYLKINIIIFDFKNENIFSAYYGNFFDPYRATIYLANYDNFWEPIVSNNKKIFSCNDNTDNILSKILINNINYYNTKLKTFNVKDDILFILKKNDLFFNKTIIEKENETFISSENFLNNLTINQLNKMKKNDLLKIISDLNLSINIEKPKKNDLINILKNV